MIEAKLLSTVHAVLDPACFIMLRPLKNVRTIQVSLYKTAVSSQMQGRILTWMDFPTHVWNDEENSTARGLFEKRTDASVWNNTHEQLINYQNSNWCGEIQDISLSFQKAYSENVWP